MAQNVDKSSNSVSRISVSMDPDVLTELDDMVELRGYSSRSQAISDMVNQQLIEQKAQLGSNVMVGTITLFYDRNTRGLQKRLSDLQFEHIDEVISSLHVHLTEDKIMEVILVQGPAITLQEILDKFAILKGVISAKLQLMAEASAILPPLHGK
ncbi:nickel-responsive transcriptional regulator NikR [Vibrio porteresiae]|uniref:Putative nickel-responsive regulator n=1 Tax=Vibrio porteresiae DSM 19223 TaxID=1123496 RepID=A0ABZ0QAT3_9VIBR|nr:nickel-responsive transcriptional regulator NikR [Vibrio porteresiae]WPC72661.1 nickel-responsive transcriptional regulator NikR [Vibrio porteresiae DSM 19223]